MANSLFSFMCALNALLEKYIINNKSVNRWYGAVGGNRVWEKRKLCDKFIKTCTSSHQSNAMYTETESNRTCIFWCKNWYLRIADVHTNSGRRSIFDTHVKMCWFYSERTRFGMVSHSAYVYYCIMCVWCMLLLYMCERVWVCVCGRPAKYFQHYSLSPHRNVV